MSKYTPNEDNSAPLGQSDNEIKTFAPPPGLTDDEIVSWVDEQMELEDEEKINAA